MSKKRVNWKKLRKQIPSKVQVGSDSFYNVFYGKDLFIGKDTECVGYTDHDARQILIDNHLSDKETVLTYLHELAHAWSDVHQLRLTENQVHLIEKSLYYVLKSNNVFKRK